jgi:hypothetical protein
MKTREHIAGTFVLFLLLILAGCKDLTGPEGPQGSEGEQGAEGEQAALSVRFSAGPTLSDPYADLNAFSSALRNVLDALPADAGNSPSNPVSLKIEGLVLSQKDHLYALYGVITRYVDLDLSGCKGTMVSATPASVYAENKAKVVSLKLPESVSLLEPGSSAGGAFKGFSGLVSVDLPGVAVAGAYAFHQCAALKEINAPRLESINVSAFARCAFETVNFPELVFLGGNAFEQCTGLSSFTAPKLKTIYNNAFSSCAALEELDFPGLADLGQSAFQNCTGLQILTAPGLESIRNNAFTGCAALGPLSFPELRSIGNSVFNNCGSLSSLNAPNLESIGNNAFNNCDNLDELTLGATPPTLGTTIFANITSKTINFKVPSASATDYQNWSTTNNTALGNTTITRTFEEI